MTQPRSWCSECNHPKGDHNDTGCDIRSCVCDCPHGDGPLGAHYGGSANPFEAIKVIEAWGLGFCLGNVVRYLCRAGKKAGEPDVRDLRKALWYLQREIDRREATV